eukprot:scaffold154780_cov23-Cyclotella_meneghiniana.AAC.1
MTSYIPVHPTSSYIMCAPKLDCMRPIIKGLETDLGPGRRAAGGPQTSNTELHNGIICTIASPNETPHNE